MITDKAIRGMVEGRLTDPAMDGLAIEAKGSKRTWRYTRRLPRSASVVRLAGGTYPHVKISAARQWAAALNEQVMAGIDPRQQRKTQAAAAITLETAWEAYWADAAAGTRKVLKPRTLADKKAVWTCDIKPRLGNRTVASITADDLWQLVERKGDNAPVRANRLAGELKIMWAWFRSRAGHRAGVRVDDDPTADLSGRHYAQSAGRTRMLSDDEIGWFLSAASEEAAPIRRVLTLLLLTGCRFAEVVEAPTSEYVGGVWTIPAARTKNAKPHVIAMGSWGRSLWEEAMGTLLAASSAGTLIEKRQWYRVRDRVHAAMERLAKRPLDRWGFHDLRRTLRSNTFRLKISYEVAEAMLNHIRTGLERRYDVGDLSGYTRKAFAKWEAHVARIAQQRP
jgi:hypothetical protein